MAHPDLHPLSLLAGGAVSASEPWAPMPYRDAPRYNAAQVIKHWDRLHVGQGMPPPAAHSPLAEGWALYHSGEFERAANLGLRHGREGLVLANQATITANQQSILSNQAKLDRLAADVAAVLANQEVIQENQGTILANQQKILANQDRILTK